MCPPISEGNGGWQSVGLHKSKKVGILGGGEKMQKSNKKPPLKPNNIPKYSNEYKLYVIMYMMEHNLSNKETKRMFLPNQKTDSAKTINEWKKIYNEQGPAGFFKMNNSNTFNIKKPIRTIDTKNKTTEELNQIINDLNLQNNAYYEYIQLLKKKKKIK